MTIKLQVGDVAPPFSLPDAHGNQVSLADFTGRRVLLYFYPEADTPLCTTQACDFRDNFARLRADGLEVIGISPDAPDKLAAFATRHELPFTLLGDPAHEAMPSYGTWGEKNMYGKIVMGTIRTTIVVGADGRVELAAYRVKTKGHVDWVRGKLGLVD
ncbi:thioredoxin-dependent thiol peroxidase [Micrococcales bacterium 31B]|nr:thioredoxin-dependent thiol peroxidase [Micrococcales bacterium 31B]